MCSLFKRLHYFLLSAGIDSRTLSCGDWNLLLGYVLILQCIVYLPVALIHCVKPNVEVFVMASYSHYSALESVTAIYNNILESFVLPCINDKSVFRLSLLIRPFSSVTKFIAKHDRVPHALRDDGEKCNVMQ